MVKISLDITKKDFFWIVPLFAVLVVGVVYAYGGSHPMVMGHSAGEIEVNNAFCNEVTGHDCKVGMSCSVKSAEVPFSGGHIYCDAGTVSTGGGCQPHAGGDVTAVGPTSGNGWACSGSPGSGWTTVTLSVVCCSV